MSSVTPKLTLNDGNQIPQVGFGVYLSPPGEATLASVSEALRIGYRHIDTASMYGNEADVGKAVKSSGIPREAVFITTKLWNADQGFDTTLKAFDQSFKNLNVDYVDLYLLHWPVEGKRINSWKALSQIKRSGRVRSIGVSNFMVHHLEEIINATGVVPAVNQIELSPYLYSSDVINFCKKNNIIVEAYSPLTRSKKLVDLKLKSIADKYAKTTAQILIRWSLQHGFVPLPKSNTPSRIKENFGVFDFEINEQDMNTLDSFNENFRTCWDPTSVS